MYNRVARIDRRYTPSLVVGFGRSAKLREPAIFATPSCPEKLVYIGTDTGWLCG